MTAATIARWERDAARAEDGRARVARPTPPIRRFSDAVRALVQLMDRCGVGGNALIARTLLRGGWRVSPETVRRIRRERPIAGPADARGTSVMARQPNHVWLIDLTSIGGVFRATTFHLAVIFDAFARRPLAWRMFEQTPTARQMTRLLQTATDRCDRPRHLISDRGVQFTAKTFRRRLRRLRVGHRLGAVGQSGSIALIERCWRTIKDAARARDRPPLSAATLEARLPYSLRLKVVVRPSRSVIVTINRSQVWFLEIRDEALTGCAGVSRLPHGTRPRSGDGQEAHRLGGDHRTPG